MFSFFKSVLNKHLKDFRVIDTFIGIKLITEETEWIHIHLATDNNTLQIEVYDPKENLDRQSELIAFARNLVESFLSE